MGQRRGNPRAWRPRSVLTFNTDYLTTHSLRARVAMHRFHQHRNILRRCELANAVATDGHAPNTNNPQPRRHFSLWFFSFFENIQQFKGESIVFNSRSFLLGFSFKKKLTRSGRVLMSLKQRPKKKTHVTRFWFEESYR